MDIVEGFLTAVAQAICSQDGAQLAGLLAVPQDFSQANYRALMPALDTREDPVPEHVWARACSAGGQRGALDELWPDILRSFLKTVQLHHRKGMGLGSQAAKEVFASGLATAQLFLRVFQNAERWMLPVLYGLCQELWLAAKDDASEHAMEEAARLVNKAFTLCINDRNPEPEASRKWGTFRVAGLLFRIYFALDQLNLCNNALRAIEASVLPPLAAFPAAHRVTYLYYVGRHHFVNERYQQACDTLFAAFAQCHRDALGAKRQILHCLIPTRLLVAGCAPGAALLDRYAVGPFYADALRCLRTGNIARYRELLDSHERSLLQMGTFVVWERLLLVGYRALLRLVVTLSGGSTRIPLDALRVALRAADVDEAGCIMANLIETGLVKGYLSQEKATLVLSQKDPFVPVAACRLFKQ